MSFVDAHVSWRTTRRPIGLFPVPPVLCMKTRLSFQPLIGFFILMQIKLIFTRKVVHLASFWKWGFLELGSSLLRSRGNSWHHSNLSNLKRTATGPATFPSGCRGNMLRFLQQFSVIFSGPCRFNAFLNNLEIKQVSSPRDHSLLVPLPPFLSMQMA